MIWPLYMRNPSRNDEKIGWIAKDNNSIVYIYLIDVIRNVFQSAFFLLFSSVIFSILMLTSFEVTFLDLKMEDWAIPKI